MFTVTETRLLVVRIQDGCALRQFPIWQMYFLLNQFNVRVPAGKRLSFPLLCPCADLGEGSKGPPTPFSGEFYNRFMRKTLK